MSQQRLPSLSDLNQDVSVALTKIKKAYFKPEMQLTFIARMPGNDARVVIISNDSMAELSRVLGIYANKGTVS